MSEGEGDVVAGCWGRWSRDEGASLRDDEDGEGMGRG